MIQKSKSQELISKGKYETLLDITGTGVFEIDIKKKAGTISDSLKEIIASENTSNDLSLNDFLDCVSKKHRQEIKEALAYSLQERKDFYKNFRISAGNKRVWVSGQGKALENEENKFLLAVTPLQFDPGNISFSGTEKYAEVFDFLPSPLLIISDDGQIRYINKTLTEITGYKHAEIPTLKHLIKNAYGEDAENLQEVMAQLFNIKSYQSDGEFKFKTRDNKIKYLHFYSAPLGKDKEGRKLIMSIAADVTEIRKKDHLIRKQAEELKILTNKLPHLLFTADSEGVTEYFNERWLEFTGLSMQEMRQNNKSILHPEDLETFKKCVRKSRMNGEPFDLDVRIKNHQEEYRWLNLRALPVQDEARKVIKWIGTGTDVHDKYVAEQKLFQKANEFIRLVEMLDHHVWVVNADGTPEFFNKAWYKYTGLTEKETMTDRMQVVHPSQREKIKYQIETAWKKEVPYEMSLKLRRYDGEYQWFLSRGQPIKNSSGKLLKYIGTITNIHTHRQLEDALKNEVAVLSEIIESIPLIAWTADSDGNMDYYNKRWYEYTAQTPDEALGWGWKKVQHPDDVDHSMDIFMNALKTGEGFENEARFLRASDNSYRWHLIKAIPVKEISGNIKYWIGTGTDIHEQKMLEQNKGQFLNVASHELRTPLTTLIGYLQLMEIAFAENNHADVKKFLSKSASSSQRMSSLVNDLLNISHIDSGKIAKFHRENLEINKFVIDIIEGYRQLHPDIQFFLQTSGGRTFVNANSFRLEQVFDNVLSNAIKYAPSSPIYVDVADMNHHVQISVTDKGEGIPQDKLKAIFDRFYRVRENSTTSGLGVGLFISKEIINEHNGDIWAESDSDGATFKFTLPKI